MADEFGELRGDGFAFAMELGEALADAGAVGVGGFGRELGGGVQFGDQVFFCGVDLLEPQGQGGGLGVVAGLVAGGPGREQCAEPFGAAGGQRVGGQPGTQDVQEEVFGGGDGAGVVGGGGGVPGVGRVVRAQVVGVCVGGAEFGVGAGDPAHAPLAQFAPDAGPQHVPAAGGRVNAGLLAVPAGGVLDAGLLGGVPGGAVHDGRVGGLR